MDSYKGEKEKRRREREDLDRNLANFLTSCGGPVSRLQILAVCEFIGRKEDSLKGTIITVTTRAI